MGAEESLAVRRGSVKVTMEVRGTYLRTHTEFHCCGNKAKANRPNSIWATVIYWLCVRHCAKKCQKWENTMEKFNIYSANAYTLFTVI